MRNPRSIGLIALMLLGGYAASWLTLQAVFPTQMEGAPPPEDAAIPGLALPSQDGDQPATAPPAAPSAAPAPVQAALSPAPTAPVAAQNTQTAAAPAAPSGGWQPDGSWTRNASQLSQQPQPAAASGSRNAAAPGVAD